MKIILDIEPSNHLKKECNGDKSKLKIGLAGIKIFGKEEYYFFEENNIQDIEEYLIRTEEIIGFNLIL